VGIYNHNTGDGFDLPSSTRQSREPSASYVLLKRSRRIITHEEVGISVPFIVKMKGS
jgi:hypothetical protein